MTYLLRILGRVIHVRQLVSFPITHCIFDWTKQHAAAEEEDSCHGATNVLHTWFFLFSFYSDQYDFSNEDETWSIGEGSLMRTNSPSLIGNAELVGCVITCELYTHFVTTAVWFRGISYFPRHKTYREHVEDEDEEEEESLKRKIPQTEAERPSWPGRRIDSIPGTFSSGALTRERERICWSSSHSRQTRASLWKGKFENESADKCGCFMDALLWIRKTRKREARQTWIAFTSWRPQKCQLYRRKADLEFSEIDKTEEKSGNNTQGRHSWWRHIFWCSRLCIRLPLFLFLRPKWIYSIPPQIDCTAIRSRSPLCRN